MSSAIECGFYQFFNEQPDTLSKLLLQSFNLEVKLSRDQVLFLKELLETQQDMHLHFIKPSQLLHLLQILVIENFLSIGLL